jgi:hypothetical protein
MNRTWPCHPPFGGRYGMARRGGDWLSDIAQGVGVAVNVASFSLVENGTSAVEEITPDCWC